MINNFFQKPKLLASLLFILMVVLTFVVSASNFQRFRDNRTQDFLSQTNQIQRLIEQRLELYANVLFSGKALFDSSESIKRLEWKTFITSIEISDNYPGIQAISFAKSLKTPDKKVIENEIKKEGFKNFQIIPEGNRDEYAPVIYIEPFDERNQRAFGFDMFSEAVRRKALVRAKDTGLPSATARITLRQEFESNTQPGFIIAVPIYKKNKPTETLIDRQNNFYGYILGSFRMHDLMNGILLDSDFDVSFEIFDGRSELSEDLIFGYKTDLPVSRSSNTSSEIFDIFGEKWTIRFTSLQELGTIYDTEPRFSIFIFLAGLLISFLFSITIYQQLKLRNQNYSQVEKLNIELVNLKEKLNSIIENIGDPFLLFDINGNITNINSAASIMLGYARDELINRNLLIIDPEFNQSYVNELQKHVSINNDALDINRKIKKKLGDLIDVEAKIKSFNIRNVRYFSFIFRDVTETLASQQKLSKRSTDLEKINNLFIARELKMAQLKKEIQELKSKLNDK